MFNLQSSVKFGNFNIYYGFENIANAIISSDNLFVLSTSYSVFWI